MLIVVPRIAAVSALSMVAAFTIAAVSCGSYRGPEFDITIASIDCGSAAAAAETAHCTGSLYNGSSSSLTQVRLTVIHEGGSESTSSATDLAAGETGDFDILLRIEKPTSYCFRAEEFESCRTPVE